MQDLMQIPDRMKWYEARFCADDMPDWYPGSYVRTEQVSPALRNVVIKAEINREKVPLRNAYKTAGQKARVRLSNGVEHCLQVRQHQRLGCWWLVVVLAARALRVVSDGIWILCIHKHYLTCHSMFTDKVVMASTASKMHGAASLHHAVLQH